MALAYGEKCNWFAGRRRLVALPGGLTLDFAPHLVVVVVIFLLLFFLEITICCLLSKPASPAKAAEPIEVLFVSGRQTRVSPRNYVFDGMHHLVTKWLNDSCAWRCDFMSNYFDRLLLLGRIACIAWMRPVATCVLRSVTCVCLCVCLRLFVCVCLHVGKSCKNGWTDRDAVWRGGTDWCGPKKALLHGDQISPTGTGTIKGVCTRHPYENGLIQSSRSPDATNATQQAFHAAAMRSIAAIIVATCF